MVRILLEDSRRGAADAAAGRGLLFENATRLIVAHEPEDVDAALAEMQAAQSDGHFLAGFFSYELGYALEAKLAALMPANRDVPLIWFGVFDAPTRLDHEGVSDWLQANAGAHSVGDVTIDVDEATYTQRFERTQELISAGDIYQINLTFRSGFDFDGDPLGLYSELRAKQPVAYGAFIDGGDFSVVSASPEVFITQDGRKISTRPMKGTAARASTLPLDRRRRYWLSSDEKSRAENLMIVDLMRNDLSRIAEPGSVQVSDLYSVETFPTLHQMTSGIDATLRADVGIVEMLQGIYPPGSITGAPKIRAMEVIRELEDSPRGVYTGTIGYFGPDDHSLLNVAIRTVFIDDKGRGQCSVGSGVVADSDAAPEFSECLLKMRFLTDPVVDLQLIETLLLTPERNYTLLDRHIERLQHSAEYFAFRFDEASVQRALADFAEQATNGFQRVRLLLSADGTLSVAGTAIDPPEDTAVMRFVISGKRVQSNDPLFYHKTTQRELYDGERARLVAETGCDEVIFFNERDELCEGAITNIFIESDEGLVTPELSSGLLPGTLRAQLIDDGKVREQVISREQFRSAKAIYLGNSVRGLVKAEALIKQQVA